MTMTMTATITMIDWVKVFTSHSTQNTSFRRRSPSQSLGLVRNN